MVCPVRDLMPGPGLDRRVEDRAIIFPLVGNRGIGAGEFKVRDAVGDAAQSQGLIIVPALEGRDTEVLDILIAQARPDLGQGLDRDNIHGFRNGHAQVRKALVGVVVIVQGSPVCIGHGSIVLDRRPA